MSLIADVRARRQKLAAVLADDDYSGIREIVEELYPDRAHFLYELLQNAEDAGAAEARFELHPDRLVFEHDGRPFDERDVLGITNIGKGTKRDQDDKIGRFGVGFKAVFAYSDTPHVWSPTFSFKITDLVLPTELPARPDLGGRTRFEFPFNNPKKSPPAASVEVRDGLEGLAETTVLFLPRLGSVEWRVLPDGAGSVLRVRHSEYHYEVLKRSGGRTTASTHFLRFDRPVEGLEKQQVSVAFALDFLPGVTEFSPAARLAKQLRVVPASPGRVAVFFPAEKESSGLRFHLHAPFVPELSRASIKDTPANQPLFEQLAALAASALHRVRDLGLLTTDFLEVLPNARDQLGGRYGPVRDAIVREMREEPLTPTHHRGHAPARCLLQGRAALKSLLDGDDLEFLVDYDDEPPRWAAGAAQRNSNADRMLESLGLAEWGVDDLVAVLANKTGPEGRDGPPENITPADVAAWLAGKPAAWHQELYALLLTDYLVPGGYRRDERAADLGGLRIVRLAGGGHGVAGESFFGTSDAGPEDLLRRVDPETYTTGRAKAEKEDARSFLAEIGVREVGEAEVVEMILKARYTYEAPVPDEATYLADLRRFVDLVEADSGRASLFKGYYVFLCDSWRVPGEVYVDRPYRETGLAAYYGPLGERAGRHPLGELYQRCGIDTARLVAFALAIGAAGTLAVEETACRNNPHAAQLVWGAPGNRTRYAVDEDYHIPGLDGLLAMPSLALSRLVWTTLCGRGDGWTTARYRNNSSYPVRQAPSQLACVLNERAWVPQAGGGFVRPREASRDLLPAGFPFDPGWAWLDAVGFGRAAAERTEEQVQRESLARELGFDDDDALERARRFASLPAEEQCRILAERERPPVDLPDREPANPARRAERVAEQAAAAAERRTEERTRSVSVNRDGVKQEAGQYLAQQYTNADGRVICQACKGLLPFQLDDGRDYFERVELLRGLRRHHRQNYLALCPNHAAMFQYANGSADDLRHLVAGAAGNEVTMVLARRETAVYFTKTHLADLRAIIAADRAEADPDPDPVALAEGG